MFRPLLKVVKTFKIFQISSRNSMNSAFAVHWAPSSLPNSPPLKNSAKRKWKMDNRKFDEQHPEIVKILEKMDNSRFSVNFYQTPNDFLKIFWSNLILNTKACLVASWFLYNFTKWFQETLKNPKFLWSCYQEISDFLVIYATYHKISRFASYSPYVFD